LIEISGYVSNTLGSKTDQKLSEKRAAAVARYLYEVQNIPMRRILIPVGYGNTHALASNANAEGRELNRRVDVKVLINKSLQAGCRSILNDLAIQVNRIISVRQQTGYPC
jgi:outer membrane protein OmpA-like peptidoglycan-associated protein